MRKRADVRSQSNRHTGCELFAKFLRMQVEQFLFALRSVRSHSVGGEVFRDGKRGYREYVLLTHQPHGLIAELECVINGHDPSLRGIQGPSLLGRRYPYTLADTIIFVDSSTAFGIRAL